MHGRTFSVSETQKVIDSVLDIDSPAKFKDAMPWQAVPPIGVSNAKLLADGMSIPPFHGRCRCVVVMAEVNNSEPVFPDLKLEEVISYDRDTRIARVSLHGLPSVGLANWKYDKVNRYGHTVRRRFFDSNGSPLLDIDFDDHGHPKAHPMGAHAHDYDKSGRTYLRKLKDWESKIVQEIEAQEGTAVKKGSKDKCQFISGRWADITDEYITLEQYKYVMEVGGEYSFIYDGHGYFTSGFGHPEALEWNNDESYRDGFKDIDDMLDNYRVHTGETLREIIPKSMLEDSPVWSV